MGPRLPVYPVAGLGSSCLPVASHTDTQMWIALSSSQILCWPTFRALCSPWLPGSHLRPNQHLPPEHLLLAGWSGLMFSHDHTNAHSLSLQALPSSCISPDVPWSFPSYCTWISVCSQVHGGESPSPMRRVGNGV